MPLTGHADCNDGQAGGTAARSGSLQCGLALAGRRGGRPGASRALLLLVAAFGFGAAAADFEVSAGYLSTNAEKLATGHGWSLVWEAGEDRLIEHPFTIANDSLRRGLEGLLGAYQGQFVADLYRSNEVVLVSTPLPQLEVVLPGAAPVDVGPEPRVSDRAASASGSDAVAAARADGEPLLAVALDAAEAADPVYEADLSGASGPSGQDAAAGSAGAQ